jgi:hypothetical protein
MSAAPPLAALDYRLRMPIFDYEESVSIAENVLGKNRSYRFCVVIEALFVLPSKETYTEIKIERKICL